MRAFIINREVDLRRWTFISKNVDSVEGLVTERIDAVDGFKASFDAAAFATANCKPALKTPETLQKKANAACFLSHVMAWQKIYDAPEPYGLILEDDVFLSDSFLAIDDDLARFGDFDLVYVNQAMVMRRSMFQSDLEEELFVSVDENYNFIRTEFPVESGFVRDKAGGKMEAPGGYGYILSKSGALKLLQNFEVDARPVELDSYVYFKALSDNTLSAVDNTRNIAHMKRAFKHNYEALNAFIYKTSLVRHKASAVGGSVRVAKPKVV